MNTKNITSPDRRGFLQSAARAAAGIAGVGYLAAKTSALSVPAEAASIDPPLKFKDIKKPRILNLPKLQLGNDIQVLNYALALEDLEADLYIQAILRLTTGGVNPLGTTIPGLGLSNNEPDVAYLREFAPVEAEHRDFLRGSLAQLSPALPISDYKYDFGIETKSREEVLALMIDVEATGVSAYLGAVPYLKTKFFVTAAASILGTEARHTSALTIVQNNLFNKGNAKSVAPKASMNHGADMPIDPDTILAKVSPFIVKA